VPVVTCPKCPTQLRVPESATGNVKCPKCQHIFPLGAKPAPAPAFEVVDDTPGKPAAKPVAAAVRPAAPARPAPSPPPPPPAKKSKPDDVDVEFEEDEAPRKKKRRDDDYEDDDDDRDRPRGRRRRDDDYEDDDDRDRPPKKKRSRRDDDYDDDDDWRPAKKGSGFGPAATGTLLMAIGMWFYVAMFGILALFFLLLMATRIPEGLMSVAGICGVGTTVLTLIGLSFCIAGPQKAKGMAIATVAVSGVHLVLVIINYSNLTGGLGRGGLGGGFVPGADWILLGTVIWVPNAVLPALIYGGGRAVGGEAILLVIAGACEIARIIMVCVTLRALAAAAKDYDSAEKASKGMIAACVVCGAAALVSLLLIVIIDASKSINTAQYLGGVGLTGICVGYALMALMAALAAMSTKGSLARMARRRG
jgi:predicted Zn finger-like uncharacterized protein